MTDVGPPNGSNDTTAIAAVGKIIAGAGGGTMQFEPGAYHYNGTGLTNANIEIGGSRGGSTIILGASSYLYQPTTALTSFYMHDLEFQGGLGAVRQAYTGTDTSSPWKLVERCYFYNYTQCAIGALTSDSPYWKVRDNLFWAATDAGTIGVALQGLSDNTQIESNDFRVNQVHVKLGHGGCNAYLSDNGFIRFNAYTAHPRYDVWVVPNPSYVNSGMGLVIDAKNKFGPENLDATHDYRIVYADEDATGTDFSTHLPNLSADSTGYITGHRVGGTFYSAGSGVNNPCVYSTTPNIRSGDFDLLTDGGQAYGVAIRTVPLAYDRTNRGSTLRLRSSTSFNPGIAPTNALSLFSRIDDTTVTTTTSAPAAGGAGALPATPKGYMTVFIAGVAQHIPYY
jgi:hypothetical protein